MKKKVFLVAALLVVTMLVTACGNSSTLNGKWKGTCDLTDYYNSTVAEANPTLAEYVNFENLTFTIYYTFDDENVSISVDQESMDELATKIEAGYRVLIEAQAQSYIAEYAGLLEEDELAQEYGYESYDELITALVDGMQASVLTDTLGSQLELEGTYVYDVETGILTVTYKDSSVEEMKAEFEGDNLVITISDGADEFYINCIKQ